MYLPANYDVRVTAEIHAKGLHEFWPWGVIFSHTSQFSRHDIPLNGPDGLILDFDNRQDEWTYVTDMSGSAMHKFLSLTKPSLEYHKEEFWCVGRRYILEIRITELL